MKRIFIAINLPDKIKTDLENLQKDIAGLFSEQEAGEAVRWLKTENFHLTLLFIGPVKEEETARICQIVEQSVRNSPPFSLKIKRVCPAPRKKIPPRLIWVELEKSPELLNLVDGLKKEMLGSGILRRVENRPFSPHITLARIKSWQWRRIEPEHRPDIEKDLDLSFEVRSIEVMESVLKRTGAEYTIVRSFSLNN